MAEQSAIAWTRSTFNPWIGCTKVGPGCDHCYAEQLDKARFSVAVTGGTPEHPIIHWGKGAPRYRTTAGNWRKVITWNTKAAAGDKPWRVFCASLGDVFDNEVPSEWRRDLFDLIEATPNLSWLLVTKRIGNVFRMVPHSWVKQFPAQVRLLITVCNQEEADRDVNKLLALPCKNGISYEPALGPVKWSRWLRKRSMDPRGSYPVPYLQWIIVGGESTQGAGEARNFNIEWARKTLVECRAAGVPAFVKQLGSAAIEQGEFVDGVGNPSYVALDLRDRAGADPAEWPEDLRVQEFPT